MGYLMRNPIITSFLRKKTDVFTRNTRLDLNLLHCALFTNIFVFYWLFCAGQAQVVSESRTELKQFASLETKSSTRMEVQEETTVQAPVFTSSPKSVDVREGQKAHFEARIIPVSDPTLKIEWFFNGQPIKQVNRDNVPGLPRCRYWHWLWFHVTMIQSFSVREAILLKLDF